MTLSSRQRRLLEHGTPPKAKAPPKKGAETPQKAPPQAPVQQEVPGAELGAGKPGEGNGEAPMGLPGDGAEKTRRLIRSIEKLQSAAAGMEAGRFFMQQELSDFSTARRLDGLKQELIKIITKAKEQLLTDSATDPEAKQIVADWFKL